MTKGAADVGRLAEELRRAYSEEVAANPDFPGLTSFELEGAWEACNATVRSRLRKLAEAGKLETGRKMVASIDGIARPTPCYRIKED